MASEEPKANHQPAQGLPTVLPPSGRHIVQLFVVPGLIVTVAVLVLLGFSWLVGGDSSSDQLLKRLQDPNPDVRWRAANDLAQRLKRDDQMAADPALAQKLTTLLQQAWEDYRRATRDLAQRRSQAPQADLSREEEALKQKRKDIQFLSPCVGTLILPIGAPTLAEIAQSDTGPDPKSVALLRRQAVWALANLGENRQRFEKLPENRRQEILKDLQARSDADTQGLWRSGLAILNTEPTVHGSGGAINGLAACADSNDPFLRKLVALTLTFWTGTPEENRLAEQTLLQLTRDDGHGVALEIGEND